MRHARVKTAHDDRFLPAIAPGHDDRAMIAPPSHLIGGAYWMPPALQSWFSPRGIFSFEPSPTLRS